MKAILTVGVSASGKSTFAKSLKGYHTVDRDKIRQSVIKQKDPNYNKLRENMWHLWDWSWEADVTAIELDIVQQHIDKKHDIVICETHLTYALSMFVPEVDVSSKSKDNLQHTKDIVAKLINAGYQVDYNFLPIAYDEALARDRKRLCCVGDYVIDKQWVQWIQLPSEFTGITKYVKNERLPKCIVVDIDGTIAKNVSGRGMYEWSKVGEDAPIDEIVELVRRYMQTHKVIFLSGRSDVSRYTTEYWLREHVMGLYDDYDLYMRTDGDYTKDRIVKESLFFTHIADKYNVEFVIDDRRQVINLWTDIGVKVLNVGNCYIGS